MYHFSAYGHKNILATHPTTLEFTKEGSITKRGDCIIGIRAGFDSQKLKKFLLRKRLKLIIKVDDLVDSVIFEPNPHFGDNREIVIRKGAFVSKRTLGIMADKAAIDISRKLVEQLRNGKVCRCKISY